MCVKTPTFLKGLKKVKTKTLVIFYKGKTKCYTI